MTASVKVYPNQYYDSVQLLFVTSSIKKMDGVETALAAMGTPANKTVFHDIGFADESVDNSLPSDLIIGVKGIDQEHCDLAVSEAMKMLGEQASGTPDSASYKNFESALKDKQQANLCIISVPAEYVKEEAFKALNAGLHVMIFSDNVPLDVEREIKELAVGQGLLCMGPDCGVANINGISFLVGSIVRKGPIGICAASGVGLQEVAALIHGAGSGISQGIGTGGKDLKDQVGGLTMLSGLDALEKDPATEVITVISRKPEDKTLSKVLERVANCTKPVVICFMGCDEAPIVQSGAAYAQNLEEAARLALGLIGKPLDVADEGSFREIAEREAGAMSQEQKYVRGLFCGGTFVEESMVTMRADIGDIYSNAPLSGELKLDHSTVSYKHSVVDYGDEEFTLGRPHPVIDTEPRRQGIEREGEDPEVAVMLLDFILGPAVNANPVQSVIDSIKQAKKAAAGRGGHLAVVASVCGTEDDPQSLSLQEKMLRDEGVLVCPDNYQAALLAAEIIKRKMEMN